MKKKSILILGSNGFLGKNFQEYIIKNNYSEKYNYHFSDLNCSHNIDVHNKFYEADLVDFKSINKLILDVNPDNIINLAGIYGIQDIDLLYKINTVITRNLLEVLRQNSLLDIQTLLVGSAAEYGECKDLPILETSLLNPVNIYGLSKKHQSELAIFYKENFKLKISIGKVFNTIGKYQPTTLSISSFINRINNLNDGDDLVTGNIDTKRDFIDVYDVISSFFSILESENNDVYNICSGYSISIREIINLLIINSGKKINIKVDESLFRKNEIMDSYGSNDKLKTATGWDNKIDINNSLSNLINHK